jgi:LysM repeat protein
MRIKFYLSALLLLLMLQGKAQRQEDIINYINTYKDLAIAEMKRTGVPAAIKLAQGIHETQAGTSDLVRRSNNHFGIKCKDNWTGERVYHDDDARGECFRSYVTPEDSYRDHSDFLKGSPRYSFLFGLDPTDYIAWAQGLKKAGYATNYHYPQILVKLIEDFNLQQYSLIAMGKLEPGEEILAKGPKGNPGPAMIQGISSDRIPVSPEQTSPGLSQRKLPQYPAGSFLINNTRVVFVPAGSALLGVAEQYGISFARLLDFNDLDNGDVLTADQLVFLQRKRKIGATDWHLVQQGETLYEISQSEGIRLESLLDFNHLSRGMQPAEGEKLYLRQAAPARPLLVTDPSRSQEANAQPGDSATTHIVQNKETLFSISKKYGVSLADIKAWNNLDSLDLKTGQQLVIHKK